MYKMSSRSLWQLVIIAGIVSVFALESVHSAVQKNSQPFQTKFADTFPTVEQLRFDTVSGGSVKGEELLGQAVLIVFFEPGCPKCTAKLPTFEKIRKTFEAEGVTFIGMSSSGGGIAGIAKNHGYDWVWATNSAGMRPKLEAHKAFEAFLFDRTGKIAYRFPIDERNWKLHLEIGLGAVLGRALDLSDMNPAFVGSGVCGMCHPKEMAQWESSPHSGSYQALMSARKNNTKECNSCHVTGEQGLKTRSMQSTSKDLQEVGCEECHGPGGPHRTKPYAQASLYSTKEESCKRCHDAALAGCAASWKEPKWDFTTALKAVSHDTPVSTTGTASAGTALPATGTASAGTASPAIGTTSTTTNNNGDLKIEITPKK